jgi:hypothetical protein
VPSSLTLSTTAIAALVSSVLRPVPDDPEPVGPGGPVIRWGDWVMLNPQPLPPRESWGPSPEPWSWAVAVRAELSRALDQFEQAAIIIVSGRDPEGAWEATETPLTRLVDDFCGTQPRPRPFPGPWGPRLTSEPLSGRSLMIAGAQFQQVADYLGDHPLNPGLEDAARRLFETGIARLEQG